MILLLETATLNCSVALATPEGDCVARRDEAGERHQHAERLHVLIDEVLRETGTERSALTGESPCAPPECRPTHASRALHQRPRGRRYAYSFSEYTHLDYSDHTAEYAHQARL